MIEGDNKQQAINPHFLVHDKDIFVELVKLKNTFVVVFIVFIIAILSLVLIGIYAIDVGKKRSYIIQRDASGRPISIIEEQQDKIYPSEIHAFMGDFINEFYTQDFGNLIDTRTKDEKINRLGRFFAPQFFKTFLYEMEEMYFRSIVVRRLITRVGLYNIRTVKIENKTATVLFDVYINLYKAGLEVGQLDRYEMQKKSVEITLIRGDRTQNNLYGVYISSFLDINTSIVREIVEEGGTK